MRPFLLLISIVFIAINSIDMAPKSRNRNNLPETLYLSSQNGTNNIQIHLKDIQIIALLTDDAFGDYDYDYDYSDFTIKPNNLSTTTTEKPENQTAPNITSTIATPVSTAVPTGEPVPTDGAPSTSPDKIRVRIIPSPELGESRQATVPEVAHSGRCASGYARDKNGRCRRIRKSGIVPIDFARIAGNFVAKFRQNLDDSQQNLQQ